MIQNLFIALYAFTTLLFLIGAAWFQSFHLLFISMMSGLVSTLVFVILKSIEGVSGSPPLRNSGGATQPIQQAESLDLPSPSDGRGPGQTPGATQATRVAAEQDEDGTMKFMFLKKRPCPNCGLDHGHTRWKVANCSVMRPLRCKECRKFFHQQGFTTGTLLYFIFPTVLPFAIHWSIGLMAMVVETLFITIYINRTQPLVPGPKYG